jgi:hypothetical protein
MIQGEVGESCCERGDLGKLQFTNQQAFSDISTGPSKDIPSVHHPLLLSSQLRMTLVCNSQYQV